MSQPRARNRDRGLKIDPIFNHDLLWGGDAVDEESNILGKAELRRIVLMLTWLILRSDSVAADASEYEYRDAEYE